MNFHRWLAPLLLLVVPPVLSAQTMGGPMMGRGMGAGGMGGVARHQYVMRNGLPEAYGNLTNPLTASEENLKAGQHLFTTYCVSCHGSGGQGNGPAAEVLEPKPFDLTRTLRSQVAFDAFFYWSIAEGGTAFNSAMPAFKGAFERDDIWQIILYLRSLP